MWDPDKGILGNLQNDDKGGNSGPHFCKAIK